MKRQDTLPIQSVVQESLMTAALKNGLQEVRVIECWKMIVGPNAEKYVQQMYVRNRKLYVKIFSPAMKSDLMMKISEHIAQVNEQVGEKVIDDIILL